MDFSMIEHVCVDIALGATITRVIVYYRPPGIGPGDLTYAYNSIKLFHSLYSASHDIVLVGDFNLPAVNWSSHHVPNNAVYSEFINFISQYGLYQHVRSPTRIDNILDLVLTNSVNVIRELSVLPPIGNSDHCLVLFTTALNIDTTCSNTHHHHMPSSYDWKHANYDAIMHELYIVDWNCVFQYCFNVQQCWNVFLQILFSVCQKYVPLQRSYKRKSNCKKAFYPAHIKNLLKEKLIAWRKWRKSRASIHKTQYCTLRINCSRAIKEYFAARELNLIEKNDLKYFYKYVNKQLSNRSSIGDIRCPDGALTSSDKLKCEAFNVFFTSVFTHDDNNIPRFDSRVADTDICLSTINFSPDIVYDTLRQLKPSTCVDPDGLPNILLKSCASALCVPLCHIFDISFKDGLLPDTWKLASVIPIFKKGCTAEPCNYRPISLTSVCCKAMERIINDSLQTYLKHNNLITPAQHGFICKRSTCTNLLESLYDWTHSAEHKRGTDVIYFDFRKAFDSVSHPKLLHKLLGYGICGKLFNWLSNFLSNRKQFVTIGTATSDMVSVTSGVPQGSVIGPTLFLIFINDLCDAIYNLNVTNKLFADDLKMYAAAITGMANCDLIAALTHIESWCSMWQLQLAIDKCNVIHLYNRHKPSSVPSTDCVYKLYNHPLSVCSSIRDLGVIVDNGLKFDVHISSIVHKALTRSCLIFKCFHSRRRDLLLKAYVTYVRPVLEYCSPVWSPHHMYLIDKIESVQKRFTKRIPGLFGLTYEDRLLALGLQSLRVRRVICDLVLCYNILNSSIDTSLSSLFTVNNFRKTRGHDRRLIVPHCTKDITKFYFVSRVTKLWNKLPNYIVNASSVELFRKHLFQPDICDLLIN